MSAFCILWGQSPCQNKLLKGCDRLNEWPLHVCLWLLAYRREHQVPWHNTVSTPRHMVTVVFLFLLKHSPAIGLRTNILLLVSVQISLLSAHSAGVHQDSSRYQLLKSNMSETCAMAFTGFRVQNNVTLSNLNKTKSHATSSVSL